jgi:hypothetical protein
MPQSARCGRRRGSGGAISIARRRCSVSLYRMGRVDNRHCRVTLGGGQGWLRRTYGMTCDSLLCGRCDHGRRRIRGGSGNFGIVTDFEYRLHPVGPVVTYAAAMYPVEAAGRCCLRSAITWTRRQTP